MGRHLLETKLCRKCNKEVNTIKFYANRIWKSEFFKDAWCKNCISEYVISYESLLEYCRCNNRKFVEKLWNQATDMANNTVENKPLYKKLDDSNKYKYLLDLKIKTYLGKMNLYYQFTNEVQYHNVNNNKNSNNESIENKIENNKKDDDTQKNNTEDDPYTKYYSHVWLGSYTLSEIKALEKLFKGLQRDFKIENESHIDYAKKVCKASLAMDQAFSDMLIDIPGSKERYVTCQKIFDGLSQSAKFAEKTRSENDTVGLGSLGEVVKTLEYQGFLQKKITFPKDEIDKVIDDFRWILTSIGEEI